MRILNRIKDRSIRDVMSDSGHELLNMPAGGEGKKRGCCRRHPVACGVTLLVVGVVSLGVVGAALGIRPYLNKTFTDTVDKQVILVPDTEGTSQFKKSSAPLYTKFYFFNVTNQDDVVNKGAHPIVSQCGPYTYREWRTKFNLKWTDNETQVHYDLNVTYTYEPTMSAGDPKKAKIITLNIPFYVLLLKLKAFENGRHDWEKEIFKIAVEVIQKFTGEKGLFTTLTVYELLYGYNDPLLKRVKEAIEHVPIIDKYADMINPWFALENITEVDTGNAVHTGKDNINLVGEFIEWKGHFEIYKHGGWGTPTAKMINGTAGFLFPPDVKRDHNLTAFISELYRSGYFSYLEDKKPYGITLYRFALPRDELVSANQDPGFYANGPDGLLNLTAVFEENAPVFASKPHFLDADPSYRNNVTGLEPDRSLHDSYLDVEPITGAVMRAAKRIQINLQLHRNGNFEEIKDIMPQLMMPVFWASEEGSLTNSLANEFKTKVYGAKYGMEAAVWGGVGLGGLVFLMMLLCFTGLVVQQCRVRRQRRHQVPAPEVEDSDDENTHLLN